MVYSGYLLGIYIQLWNHMSQDFIDVDYIVSPFPERNLILEAWYGVSEALLQLLLSEGYLIESRRPL